ncbi:translation initiation factor eif-2b delta subunit [Paecilomyces variotii No. 5]|uniref:Translation initiation factor eIF2B subunit delta n=1 Tax=Byssochlamys spectabilis (strain No. 5 / NBRC 109023) TaxID=1356009 RepID=V5I618_BYSSN|nr:translation initiation factor eif-2b delta subunit [Paecilomyces variotii No. 5]
MGLWPLPFGPASLAAFFWRWWHHIRVSQTAALSPQPQPQPPRYPEPSNAPLDVRTVALHILPDMSNPTDPDVTSAPPAAAPAAPVEQKPAEEVKQEKQTQQTSTKPKETNGGSKPAKQPKSTDASADGGAVGGAEKLTGAELKKKAKAEKAARRAKEKLEREQAGGAGAPSQAQGTPKKGQSGGGKDNAPSQLQKGQRLQPPRRGSAHILAAESKKEDKNVAVFGHLYGQQRRTTIAGAGKEVHPAVLALGLQMRDYVICGSSARCVATLLAFKRVIESYTTPVGTSLARHLMTHLSHQITYLSTCRPLSISQGNAIRALKLSISSIDPAVPEATAKTNLCDFIDSFIREKITLADQVIASKSAEKIQDGDVIVTFAGSSIVKQTLITAHEQGKKFRVSVIDSRPLFEGKNLARALANAGLEVQYSLTHGISHAIKDATKVFLGAHAMTGNGRLYSRVGTALVAMSAKERSGGAEIPVIVCCETVKFTDRVALDSIVVNEIADADEMVAANPPTQVTGLPDPNGAPPEQRQGKGSKSSSANIENSANSILSKTSQSPLKDWKETPNLQLLNILYDATPAEYVDMVITEMGSLPPSAVPIVHRMSTNS